MCCVFGLVPTMRDFGHVTTWVLVVWGLCWLFKGDLPSVSLTSPSALIVCKGIMQRSWLMDWMHFLWRMVISECIHLPSMLATQLSYYLCLQSVGCWTILDDNRGARAQLPWSNSCTTSAWRFRTKGNIIVKVKAEIAPLNILNDWRCQYRLIELHELARTNNINPKTMRAQEKKCWATSQRSLESPLGAAAIDWWRATEKIHHG